MRFARVSRIKPKNVYHTSSLDFIGEDDKNLIKYLQLLYNGVENVSPSIKSASVERPRSQVFFIVCLFLNVF
jgi:hypothetical protein